jgi:hypothetical protein
MQQKRSRVAQATEQGREGTPQQVLSRLDELTKPDGSEERE